MLEYTGSFFLPGFLSTAEVAELADALASGASGRKVIGVRVPASAPVLASLVLVHRWVVRHAAPRSARRERARVPASAPEENEVRFSGPLVRTNAEKLPDGSEPDDPEDECEGRTVTALTTA